MELRDLQKIGRRVLEELGRSRMKGAQKLERGAGGDRSYAFDKKAEGLILEMLKALGKPFRVVTEETGILEINGKEGELVVIDPVDGSRNAAAGMPFYGTSIAVASGNKLGSLRLGYIINLVNGDEFVAEKGKGAFFNGEPAHTQADDSFRLVTYETQVPARDLPGILPVLKAAWKTRCMGATALDLGYVASGAASLFVNPAPSRSYDFAAGYLIVKEAGGTVTDTRGGEMDDVEISMGRGPDLLASGNGRLHRAALDLLNG